MAESKNKSAATTQQHVAAGKQVSVGNPATQNAQQAAQRVRSVTGQGTAANSNNNNSKHANAAATTAAAGKKDSVSSTGEASKQQTPPSSARSKVAGSTTERHVKGTIRIDGVRMTCDKRACG